MKYRKIMKFYWSLSDKKVFEKNEFFFEKCYTTCVDNMEMKNDKNLQRENR